MKFLKTVFHWLGLGHGDEKCLQAKYLNECSKFVDLDGLRIHYRVEGSGAPIVLVHGFLSSLHTWDEWCERLKEKYTVYRMDLPGFGFSTLPVNRELYSEEELTDIMCGLFDKLGLSKIHLVGNSLGGYIAWNYACKKPHQVKSLTVISPLCYSQKIPFLLRIPLFPLIGNICRYMVPQAIFNIGFNQVFASPALIASPIKSRYFELLMRQGNKSNFVTVAAALKRIAEHPALGDKIKQIKVPVLVMWGLKDDWISVELADRWQQDLSDAKVVIYPDGGHVLMEELPQKTAEDFTTFIEQQTSDA